MSIFSRSPTPPYYAAIFTSKLLQNDLVYQVMLDKMLELARQQPGFIGVDNARDEVGILVSYWQDLDSIRLWKEHTLHDRVQEMSKKSWFEAYQIRIVKVIREYGHTYNDNTLLQSSMPEIATERGHLMLLEVSQAPLLHTYVNENRAFFAPWEPNRHESYYSLETCELRIKDMRKDFVAGKGVVLCLLNKQKTKILAYSNYSNIIRGVFQACHLGYSIAQDEQGKGLMQEALLAGIHYMDEMMAINRIMANYMPTNIRSAAVLARCGFEIEGKARRYLKIAGNWEDHILTAKTLR